MSEPILQIRGLRVSFRTDAGVFPAVDGVDLELCRGETLCVVGESGCGKSVMALSVLRLLPEPPAEVEAGEILFQGQDLLAASPKELQAVRGNQISMIFQEPMTSLNPVFNIGNQIGEALKVHTDLSRRQRRDRVVELLDLVGIDSPGLRLRDYPHQLSGGMRQRVMIAMALSCSPDVLIADEPTTALDVTIQAQILELIEELKQRMRLGVLLITHDLGVVAEVAQRVAVLYAGRVVETAGVREIFAAPRHPYTYGLLRSMTGGEVGQRQRLHTIPGVVPDLAERRGGCHFRDRCSRALELCGRVDPELAPLAGGRLTACHNPVPAAAGIAS
ncbi:MAG: ABC transporter ATP-binding protein [Myxococcales bacterium]|nr:ABC transporter ATP-binding protein [Myxococcales bacterium]